MFVFSDIHGDIKVLLMNLRDNANVIKKKNQLYNENIDVFDNDVYKKEEEYLNYDMSQSDFIFKIFVSCFTPLIFILIAFAIFIPLKAIC